MTNDEHTKDYTSFSIYAVNTFITGGGSHDSSDTGRSLRGKRSFELVGHWRASWLAGQRSSAREGLWLPGQYYCGPDWRGARRLPGELAEYYGLLPILGQPADLIPGRECLPFRFAGVKGRPQAIGHFHLTFSEIGCILSRVGSGFDQGFHSTSLRVLQIRSCSAWAFFPPTHP